MILDRLPSRITGFFERSEPPRSIDPNAFKRACYLVAQTEGGSVEDMNLDRLGRSFYGATLRTPTDHLSVLANYVHPYLGFVPPRSLGLGCHDLTFVEPVRLAATFAAMTEFRPLDADWLAMDLKPDLLTDLHSGELEQVKYWKPQRVGDLIFNNWD